MYKIPAGYYFNNSINKNATYDAFKQAGWTDDQLIARGFLKHVCDPDTAVMIDHGCIFHWVAGGWVFQGTVKPDISYEQSAGRADRCYLSLQDFINDLHLGDCFCVYDNNKTFCREWWVNGEKVRSVSEVGLVNLRRLFPLNQTPPFTPGKFHAGSRSALKKHDTQTRTPSARPITDHADFEYEGKRLIDYSYIELLGLARRLIIREANRIK